MTGVRALHAQPHSPVVDLPVYDPAVTVRTWSVIFVFVCSEVEKIPARASFGVGRRRFYGSTVKKPLLKYPHLVAEVNSLDNCQG